MTDIPLNTLVLPVNDNTGARARSPAVAVISDPDAGANGKNAFPSRSCLTRQQSEIFCKLQVMYRDFSIIVKRFNGTACSQYIRIGLVCRRQHYSHLANTRTPLISKQSNRMPGRQADIVAWRTRPRSVRLRLNITYLV